MNPPAASSRAGRAAVAFIFVTVVIDVLGFGVIIPVLPKLVVQFLHGDTARAAQIYGLFSTAWATMQFLFSPLLGAISDRFGRRPVILISCFGLGLDYLVMALAPTVGWLLLGRIVSGICASSFSTAGAYIADVSPPEKRASAYGLIGAAFGVGFVLGPALGGWLGSVDPRLPFWGAAGLALLNASYGLFILPESLPRERRSPAFSWKRANPVGSLTLLRSHPELLELAGVNFLFQIAHYVLPSVFVLYTGYRYGWDARAVGVSLTAVGVLNIAVQGFLVKPAVRALGERGALYAGLAFGLTGFVGFALAPSGAWLWGVLPVFALMGLFGPGLQSLMTRRVAPSEQGQLQGANASIVGIAGLLGPGLFTQIFAWFIGARAPLHLPGAPFLLAAGLLTLALMLAAATGRIPHPAPVTANDRA
jgi:DHA1 family tetracycline resistance protein-like MFS transporter